MTKVNIIISRHGNTFEPDEKVVWAGATNDLPLAAKGIEQAKNLGAWLATNSIKLDIAYTLSLIHI